jgi:hypothetical protein
MGMAIHGEHTQCATDENILHVWPMERHARRIYSMHNQWDEIHWEYTPQMTNGLAHKRECSVSNGHKWDLSVVYLGEHLVMQIQGICSTCDQWNDIHWEYTRLVTNQTADPRNILNVWPMEWHTLRIYSTCDQSNSRSKEYTQRVTNGMTYTENTLDVWLIKQQIKGIYSTYDQWNDIHWEYTQRAANRMTYTKNTLTVWRMKWYTLGNLKTTRILIQDH